MIDRYNTKEMKSVWSEQNKYATWLKVEIEACKAWNKLGMISKEELDLIVKNASFDYKRIVELEEETKHDVIAFTRAVSETLGEEKKWIHYGLTSTDIVDTSLGYILKQVNYLIYEELVNLSLVLVAMADKYKYSPCIGRTHGVHAEIMTFGLKVSLWYDELQRHIKRFKEARSNIEVGKIAGAVGTFSNTPPMVQDYVCLNLGLSSANIATQTLQRDRHAQYVSTIALIGSFIEKVATEIRSLQRTEINEVREGFAKSQKGSSAMPHKQNPISSENLVGCSRILRGYMVTAFENMNLWHERDISHSSAERVILPDATTLLHYMLRRFITLLENLEVDEQAMLDNIYLTNGSIFSGQVLNKLVEKGLPREKAYDLIQPIAIEAYRSKEDYRTLLAANERITALLTPEELVNCFDLKHHLKEIDAIYKRVFKAQNEN